MAYQQQNYLSRNKATMMIDGLENVHFTFQQFNLPEMVLPPAIMTTPFSTQKFAGEHIEYGTFEGEFLVDEDFSNFRQLHDWVRGLGFPEEYKEYRVKKNLYKNGVLQLYTNKSNPSVAFSMIDMYPSFLSGITFDTRVPETIFMTAHVRFEIQRYNFMD